MSTRTPDDRAEARRRARAAARGELPEDNLDPVEPEPATRNRGLLTRFFPPAPPLPNRPDPLAGFDRTGPLRMVRERAFLLRRNLVAWMIPGVVAFIGFFASFFYAGSVLELVGTFLLFGALIAAGWFGWQRPTLFGVAAALLSFFLSTALILFTFARLGAGPETFGTPATVIANFVLQSLYQSGLGFLGGWYGGYLRRRQTQLSGETKRRR